MLKNLRPGHEISSDVVLHHRLKADQDYRRDYERFLRDRIYEELKRLATTAHCHFNMGDVAILFDVDIDLYQYSTSITQMLLKDFNISTQTIAEQIKTNNVVDLVVDQCKNVNSFECAAVVVVTRGRRGVVGVGGFDAGGLYNVVTRARSKLIILNTNFAADDITFANSELIEHSCLIQPLQRIKSGLTIPSSICSPGTITTTDDEEQEKEEDEEDEDEENEEDEEKNDNSFSSILFGTAAKNLHT